jgi:hypothetical protein
VPSLTLTRTNKYITQLTVRGAPPLQHSTALLFAPPQPLASVGSSQVSSQLQCLLPRIHARPPVARLRPAATHSLGTPPLQCARTSSLCKWRYVWIGCRRRCTGPIALVAQPKFLIHFSRAPLRRFSLPHLLLRLISMRLWVWRMINNETEWHTTCPSRRSTIT